MEPAGMKVCTRNIATSVVVFMVDTWYILAVPCFAVLICLPADEVIGMLKEVRDLVQDLHKRGLQESEPVSVSIAGQLALFTDTCPA